MINEVTFKNSSYLSSPERFEPGTLSLEAIIGLGAAIDYMNDVGMDTIYTHEKNLTDYTLGQLQNVNGLTLLGSTNRDNRIGVFSFTIDGVHPHDIAQILAERNICVRAGHHCAMPLHKKFGIPASTRVSLQLYNDQQDIDSLIQGLKDVARIFSV
jgi:cysteine desulfurase/selenocysteine lyase